MPTEIEAKMALDDVASLEARLIEAGAQRGQSHFETNTFFDTEDQALKSTDQGLRLRVERFETTDEERYTITHKGPRAQGQVKMRSETEVGVTDARAAADLLGALGYQPVLSFEKRRSRWELDGCHVEIDRVPYLGDFVEIEGHSERQVLAVRKKLGLEDAPMIQSSYIAMLSTYVREHNIQTDHIGFEMAEK